MADDDFSPTEAPDYMQIRDRPLGVTILSILHVLGGLMMLPLLAALFANSEEAQKPLQELGLPFELLVAGMCFLAISSLLSGVGLFLGRKWGWWLAAFYYVYSIVRHGNALLLTYELAELDGGGGRGIGYHRAKFVARIVVAVLVLVYLFRGRVLDYFRFEPGGKLKRLGIVIGVCILMVFLFSAGMALTTPE